MLKTLMRSIDKVVTGPGSLLFVPSCTHLFPSLCTWWCTCFSVENMSWKKTPVLNNVSCYMCTASNMTIKLVSISRRTLLVWINYSFRQRSIQKFLNMSWMEVPVTETAKGFATNGKMVREEWTVKMIRVLCRPWMWELSQKEARHVKTGEA